jgi:5-methylcytosine-specific restriction endonuclease McrA
MDTLVVDSQGMPVRFVPWEVAVTDVHNRRAIVLHKDPERILHSRCFEMNMPRVIQMRNRASGKMFKKIPLNRRNVARRDNSTCQYCGKVMDTNEYTMDHVVPQALGGKTVWTNIVLACVPCNKDKGCQPLSKCGMVLRSVPKEPSPYDARFNFRLRIRKMRPEWKEWESWLYWNIELDK